MRLWTEVLLEVREHLKTHLWLQVNRREWAPTNNISVVLMFGDSGNGELGVLSFALLFDMAQKIRQWGCAPPKYAQRNLLALPVTIFVVNFVPYRRGYMFYGQ